MGGLDTPLPAGMRPGKGAFLVAEELAFEQVLRDGAAIDRDERTLGAVAQSVDCASDELFSRPAIAPHENAGVGARNPAHRLEYALHGGAKPDDSLERFVRAVSLKLSVLSLELVHVKSPAQDDIELVNLDRLVEVVVGAEADRAERVLSLSLPGDDDHLRAALLLQDLVQNEKAFFDTVRIGRKTQIERDERHAMLFEKQHCRGPVFGFEHLVVFGKRPLHLGADVFDVIHDE